MKKCAKFFALLVYLMTMLVFLAGCSSQTSVVGTWVLTDMAGSEDAETSMEYYSSLGATVTMIINEDQLTMEMTVLGQLDHDTVNYHIEGNKIITDVSEMEYLLEGKTLTLTTNGVSMIFTRTK